MGANLTINISSSDWTTINRRSYLLSIGELGGPLFASFQQFKQCNTLVYLSTKWVDLTFGEIKGLLTSIDGISDDFQQVISQIKSNYIASSSITNNQQFGSIKSSITSLHTKISGLVSNSQNVLDEIIGLSELKYASAKTNLKFWVKHYNSASKRVSF